MSKRGDKEFFKDIIEAIDRIQRYTRNMSFEEFLKDIKTGDAVIRNFEIIGETVKNLTGDYKESAQRN